MLSLALLAGSALAFQAAAAPAVLRLTPPSELFATQGASDQVISRFLPGQRFDLQATVRPDPGQTITGFSFAVDGIALKPPGGTTSLRPADAITATHPGAAVASLRAYSITKPGLHKLAVTATQSDGATATATGNFEVVGIEKRGRKVRNIIILLGDGMGAAHRTAARIMAKGYAQGRAKGLLAMDTFPFTGMVMTASLNSIVTDSSPGMANYVNGNKAANNMEGVFPDDTKDAFDNPRVEYLAEYLHRTQGTALGLVTTADVFDATPAANAVHTSNRGYGTGIVDQYLDDRRLTGLSVLMGGGRKWFLPNPSDKTSPQAVNGSQRRAANDYVLPGDIVAGWGAAPGALDSERDLIGDFAKAGFAYAPDNATLQSLAAKTPDKLLGLFSYSNMNVAYDKIAKRRGQSSVVDAFGFPDQPMLDEMATVALEVLAKNPRGFIAMIEGASIDKQAHLMDTDRWILEVLEFDRAVQVARDFAATHPDTLVIVTADHECSGAAIIGASKVGDNALTAFAGGEKASLRDKVVGVYEQAGFPRYRMLADGYPETTDIDQRMLIGYGANADRYETWRANPLPTRDVQQPFASVPPLDAAPANPGVRHAGQGFLVTGQVPGDQAVHTGTDVPLSAYGRGSSTFSGVYDNTDVFFKLGQAVLGGVR
ncbi:MAG: alkaline phosphatase [Betaproteobacteria bacterium]